MALPNIGDRIEFEVEDEGTGTAQYVVTEIKEPRTGPGTAIVTQREQP